MKCKCTAHKYNYSSLVLGRYFDLRYGGHISRSIVNCDSLVAKRFTILLQQSIKCHFSNSCNEVEVVCKRVSSKRQLGKLNPTLQDEETAKYVFLENLSAGLKFMGPCHFTPSRSENSIIFGCVIYNFIKLFCDRTYFTQYA